ncbi:MAG TPA: aminopeptidase, partial [Verrucomicrobiales bacterium]|nr:aminopeptidase [Verrucomicrobiales bacterium]
MTDPRYSRLASLLVNYSCRLKKGENVLIDVMDIPDEMTVELVRAARKARATPAVDIRHSRITRELLRGTNEKHARLARDLEMARMKKMHAYIAIRGSHNATESSDVPSKLLQMYSKTLRPVQNYRVNKTKWVVLRWPTPSMAQAAGMSTEAFEDLYFDVCTLDYAKMSRAMKPLEKLMTKTDKVHLKGPGTDLKFSIKRIGAKMCGGDRNIPDGEVFSCPVKDSVNGVIQFNTAT